MNDLGGEQMKRKNYISPEFDLVRLQFDKIMKQVEDSQPENSGFLIDDEEYDPGIQG